MTPEILAYCLAAAFVIGLVVWAVRKKSRPSGGTSRVPPKRGNHPEP